MAEILSRKKKVLQQDGALHLVQEHRVVQLGYESYGEDVAHYLARRNQKGELEQEGPEYDSLEEARKALDERTRQKTTGPEKVAPKDAPEPSQPEKDTPKRDAPSPKAPEQSMEDLVKDWPQSIAPKKPTLEPEVPAPEFTAQTNRREFPRIKPPKTLLGHPRNNKPMVLDHGDHITVTRRALLGIGKRAQEKRENAVATGLQAAAERFGQPVHFEGSPAFLKETADMAVKLGIALEPGNKLAEYYYQKALEKQAKDKQVENAKGNFFAQSVEKQKERKSEVGKGLER